MDRFPFTILRRRGAPDTYITPHTGIRTDFDVRHGTMRGRMSMDIQWPSSFHATPPSARPSPQHIHINLDMYCTDQHTRWDSRTHAFVQEGVDRTIAALRWSIKGPGILPSLPMFQYPPHQDGILAYTRTIMDYLTIRAHARQDASHWNGIGTHIGAYLMHRYPHITDIPDRAISLSTHADHPGIIVHVRDRFARVSPVIYRFVPIRPMDACILPDPARSTDTDILPPLIHLHDLIHHGIIQGIDTTIPPPTTPDTQALFHHAAAHRG